MAKRGKRSEYDRIRKRISDIIEVGFDEDFWGRGYDVVNFFLIVVNLAVSVMLTYDSLMESMGELLLIIEAVTMGFFLFDLILRIWTAGCIYPGAGPVRAVFRYIFSFQGIVDVLSCVPYYLPVFFPGGVMAFRIFRVMRIFRIFRINAYFDSLNVISAVIRSKARLLISSVFIILMLMLASSLTMYGLEHDAQPEAFDNALSGMWWAAASLLTVGYGDIYPVTTAGRIVGMGVTMLGVGLVAIPTGIISAGFVEQYEKLRIKNEEGDEAEYRFIRVLVNDKDRWAGMTIAQLNLPHTIMIAAVLRGDDVVIPRGEVEIMAGDMLVLGVDGERGGLGISLKEITLKEQHPWNGKRIKDLDISRQSFLVKLVRRGREMVPKGDMKLLAGDEIVMYTKNTKNRE